jgi:predicted GIY-YIG superfamily endonuclease
MQRFALSEMVRGKGDDSSNPCVYVGSTGRSPEERFQQHMEGNRAAPLVRRYGIALMPRLYERYNPMSGPQAAEFESGLARRLRNKGYAVWQR